jgi:beta-glucosidase
MNVTFPPTFLFGTSTSAYQIETAYDHDWRGVVASDGIIFDKTTDHESRIEEDAAIIASLAPSYRMSIMWSKIQRGPYAPLDPATVAHYHRFLDLLAARGVSVMMVLHHWCNPNWFVALGGWEKKQSVDLFCDFARRLIDEFGHKVSYWNTFNEPNLYVTFSYVLGEFPPYAKDIFNAIGVASNLSQAHVRVYHYLKEKFPASPVGISHNCVSFHAENIAGKVPAKFADYWYTTYLSSLFDACDFVGISYYAKLSFDPYPISYLRRPELFLDGRPHDDIWEYYPAGLYAIVKRYHKRFCKPVIITENGICTSDDTARVRAIKDYMLILSRLLEDGVNVVGYYHWSSWDNFEWTLGPSYQFGLYGCDLVTKERRRKPSADVYASLAYNKQIQV